MSEQKNPKVFISYTWDSESHKDWVRGLADRLLENGVEVFLDQYELSAGKNLHYIVERAMREVDMVLLIFTERYKTKSEEREGGVGTEASMITAQWYRDQRTDQVRFIPILRQGTPDTAISIFAKSFIYIDMTQDEAFGASLEKLLRAIYNAPKHVKPKVGKRPDFAAGSISDTPAPPTLEDSVSSSPQPTTTTSLPQASRQFKRELKDLIGKNRINDVIRRLEDYADEQNDPDLDGNVLTQRRNWSKLTQDRLRNLVSSEQDQLRSGKIVSDLLILINTL